MRLDRPDLSSFESTVAALFSRTRGQIEPGAHRMLRLLSSDDLRFLGTVPTLLVAGTNGKGTMCALLEQALRDHNFNTGLYTSPHIVSPTERVRIKGRPISDVDFIHYARCVFIQAQSHLPDATFFELMTAIAFRCFRENGVDGLVCEVGLGGRLDSTNITAPTVSILTSIGLDHTEWLGDNECSIAFEKACISRRNRPLICGPLSASAKTGVYKAVAITGANVEFVDPNSDKTQTIQPVAQAALTEFFARTGRPLFADSVRSAANHAFWPARFDLRTRNGVPILFDAAHNSHGVKHFLSTCRQDQSQLPRPWTLVYATLSDKDWQRSLELLLEHFHEVILTKTQSTRAVPTELLQQYACSLQTTCSLSSYQNVPSALQRGLEIAHRSKGTLFVLGSITLIGESFETLNFPVFPEQPT